ncbi:hypothetical protein ACVIGB_001011 [Bradyrhizobium sp. USDA 4341]
MALQLKRTFELIDPSTFDSDTALRKAATEYHRDLTFDGDDDDLEEDIWLARRPAECDPDNHPAVLVNSFTKVGVWSQDFAYVLHLLTGWPMMAVRVQTDEPDDSEMMVYFVRNPDGRVLDASGWANEAAVLARGDLIDGSSLIIVNPKPGSQLEEFDEDGREMMLKEIADVIRAFPHAPFRESWFRAMTFRKLAGVDEPPVLVPHGEKMKGVAYEWLAMAGDNECARRIAILAGGKLAEERRRGLVLAILRFAKAKGLVRYPSYELVDALARIVREDHLLAMAGDLDAMNDLLSFLGKHGVSIEELDL